MQVNGIRTIQENVSVDVDPETVLTKLYSKSIPVGFDYINPNDRHWYRESGFDYHKREELYTKGRKATDEEMKEREAYYILLNMWRRIK